MKKFFQSILAHILLWREGRKRLKDLKKRDPFIY